MNQPTTVKKVPVRLFVAELLQRIEATQSIDCCREEIKIFARLAADKMGDEEIEIAWRERPEAS